MTSAQQVKSSEQSPEIIPGTPPNLSHLFDNPVHPLRHGNLEPGAFARSAVLGDRDAGYGQDLTGTG